MSTFSGRLSKNCVLWIYLNIIGYRKILIGHFMTSYKIFKRYLTISFWDNPDAHWNIRRIAFVNLGQGILRIKCAV